MTIKKEVLHWHCIECMKHVYINHYYRRCLREHPFFSDAKNSKIIKATPIDHYKSFIIKSKSHDGYLYSYHTYRTTRDEFEELKKITLDEFTEFIKDIGEEYINPATFY